MNIDTLNYVCFKVLPLVYDETLSYYEVVCKVTEKLNEVIDDVNQIPELISKEVANQLANDNDLFNMLFDKIIKVICTDVDNSAFTSVERFGGEIFWHNGELVECIKHMDVGTNYVKDTNIKSVNALGLMQSIRDYISTKTEKYNERADREIKSGEYLFWKDKFLKAKQNIANDTILTDEMFEVVHIGDELKKETDARVEYDKVLKNDITNEANARKETDDNLYNSIVRNKALIDNLQNIPEGSTTSDAALNAIKTDFTNVTYQTPVDGVNNGDIKTLSTGAYCMDELKKFSDLSVNLFNKTSLSKVNGYYNAEIGEVIEENGYNISGPIFVKKGTTYQYTFSSLLGNNTSVFYCDECGTIFKKTRIVGKVTGEFNVFTAPFSGLIVINVPSKIIEFCMFCEKDKWPSKYVEFKSNTNEKINSNFIKTNATREDLSNIITQYNLANKNTMVNGYIGERGKLVMDSNYKTTDYIPIYNTNYVKNSKDSSFGNRASALFLYASKTEDSYITTIYGTKLEDNWYAVDLTNTPAAYCRSSYVIDQEAYLGVGSTKPSTIPSSTKFLANDISVLSSNIVGINYSPLKDKVWYILGDSASHGDFSSITQPTIPDGMYAGQLPVYPYYIGNRTHMIVHNNARNGAVLTDIDADHRYSFTHNNNFINDIGADADYITIWLGANDMWNNAPIGDINDTDPTTFYGAWNVIMNYIVTNYPNAKLGIVASFWCTKEYAEATINTAKKYGVPCLNLYNDPNVPITVGSKRPDIPSNIREIRNSQWVVSSTNAHPSAKYHEIESYFIENWLLSL